MCNLAHIHARLRPHFSLDSSQETSVTLEEFQSLCGIITVDVFVWGKWVEAAVQLGAGFMAVMMPAAGKRLRKLKLLYKMIYLKGSY